MENNYQVATSRNSLLIDLLNDDTFVAWIKEGDNLPIPEKRKWNEWLDKSSDHAIIVKQAKKILEMPFSKVETDCNSSGELDRLLKKLNKEV